MTSPGYPNQSLLSLIVASVCLGQNVTLCAPLPIRHDASLIHLVISQNETDDTLSSVPKLFLSDEEDQLFPRLRWFAMTYQPLMVPKQSWLDSNCFT
ncbi:MAG: hypothetical protein OK452_06670 [Thaumarchaeota archaeon]|nr:hypothetical protein [Nitrososphaerota archaeon]